MKKVSCFGCPFWRSIESGLCDTCLQIIITTYGELDKNNYLDPRTAQVATVDHVKQVVLKDVTGTAHVY
jgi:hypothetical protein